MLLLVRARVHVLRQQQQLVETIIQEIEAIRQIEVIEVIEEIEVIGEIEATEVILVIQ